MRILVNKILGLTPSGEELHYIEAAGSDGEAKPNNESVAGIIVDGSNVLLTDTAEVYFWNENAEGWIKA